MEKVCFVKLYAKMHIEYMAHALVAEHYESDRMNSYAKLRIELLLSICGCTKTI